MVKYNAADFIEIDFDIYANDILVNTSNEKLAKEKGLKHITPKSQIIILGKDMILKKVDDNILSGKNEDTLDLKPEEAYGKFDNKLISTYSESMFKEQKLRVVVGMAYNFDGKVGVVKSFQRGRVLVDFNHLLAGKNIKIKYSVKRKIESLKDKIDFILENIVSLPKKSFESKENKDLVNISLDKSLEKLKDFLLMSLKQNIIDLDDKKINFSFDKKNNEK